MRLALLAGISVAAAGCGDSLGFEARFPNTLDTTVVHALRGTAISAPSGFDIVGAFTVRTELGQDFDFAFDIDTADIALIYPAASLGVRTTAGLQATSDAFDAIELAPLEGYVIDSALAVRDESVFLARSRTTSQLCGFLGALPRYGKFRVVTIDRTARTITLEHLVDVNCGFRGLKPGIPDR